jgi:hypothetical protein
LIDAPSIVVPDGGGSIRAGGDHQVYLNYLGKEMTIMGILSAFAVIAPSVILDRTFGASSLTGGASLWSSQSGLILLASAAMFVAALSFYRQRSDLAFYYSMIAISLTSSAYKTPTTAKFVRHSDRWSAWRNYFTGFGFLALAFAWYGLAVVAYERWWTLAGNRWTAGGTFILIALCFSVHQWVLHNYDKKYYPWTYFWHHDLLPKLRYKSKAR